jgi:hypothetical protein
MGSMVTCGHGGTVQTTSSAKLTVNKMAVLLEISIDAKAVSNCTTVPKSDTSGIIDKTCTTVTAIAAGAATKLTISKQFVMLDTLKGSTDGIVGKAPQLLLQGTANQTKLIAS